VLTDVGFVSQRFAVLDARQADNLRRLPEGEGRKLSPDLDA
jgi:hypothetical protein